MMSQMRLVCYGISFHETSLSEREPVVFTASQQRQVLRAISRQPHIHEGLALCTCNRTELYLYAEAGVDTKGFVRRLIAELNPKGLEVWRQHHYIYEGIAAVEHLFRVAAGLDSQMLGEKQILRQVKDAYSASIEEGTSRFFLHRCAWHISCGKSVVPHGYQRRAVSISAAAVDVGRRARSIWPVRRCAGRSREKRHWPHPFAQTQHRQLDVLSRNIERAHIVRSAANGACPYP